MSAAAEDPGSPGPGPDPGVAPALAEGRARRDWLLLLPATPALALLASVWLPFVNAERLWFGMPSLYVWICAWVLALTPALAAVEWGLWRPRERAGGERR
ncbi:hypothetical protein AB0D24_15200 [Streptomyces javensis]|uniref:hypothetical protein n=1 Tax=Streptomyces javensis TaxID=114698 RepID=UPI0033FAA697